MPSFPLRARWLVAGVARTAAVTAGIAYAAIPDTGGVVHSCFTKSSGAWRVIDVGDAVIPAGDYERERSGRQQLQSPPAV
jgi:hypothetical protein